MPAAPHPRMHGVSHVPGGPDPIPGLAKIPSGDTLDAVISGFDPAGIWKLDESSGSVAADSSGNGNDLTADTLPPLWAAPAGPPGTQAADFDTSSGSNMARVARPWASALTGDFTAGVFVSRNSTVYSQIMGQGKPSRAGQTGWELELNGTSDSPAGHVRLVVSGIGNVTSDNPLAASTWAMVATVHSGTVWTMYVNGLAQASTMTGTATGAASPHTLWIGNDAHTGGGPAHFVGSYGFLIPTALSGADLLQIYESATSPADANAGKVLTATGLGGTTWEFPIPQDGAEGDVLTIVGGVPTWQAP